MFEMKSWLTLSYVLYVINHPMVKKTVIGLVLSIIMLALTYAGYWLPLHQDSNRLSQEIKYYSKEIKDILYQEKISNLYNSSLSMINHIDKKLNARSSQAAILQNLYPLFRKWNIELLNLSYEEGKRVNEYTPLYQETIFKCAYPDFRKFLLDVNELPTWVVVEEARIEKIPNSNGKIKAFLRLATYRNKIREKENFVAISSLSK